MATAIERFDIPAPDQMEGLVQALDRHTPSNIRRLALLVKVGGEYEDGAREKAKATVDALLQEHGLLDRTEMVTVIGCEGASTPYGLAIIDDGRIGPDQDQPRLALGLARMVPPDESVFDQPAYADHVAAAVTQAMADAGLKPEEVVVVILNIPPHTSGNYRARGRKARAVAALGIGVAVGEISREQITEQSIVADPDLYTTRAQTFIGPTVKNLEVIVLGNRTGVGGTLLAHAGVTTDLLDVRSIKRALRTAGLRLDEDGEIADPSRIVAAIYKAGPGPNGTVLGSPTVILNSATPSEKHVRAAMSGAMGSALQTTRIFSTADPVQQAPLGGGHFCFIVRA
jgi:cyanuric acid amidohydrolase